MREALQHGREEGLSVAIKLRADNDFYSQTNQVRTEKGRLEGFDLLCGSKPDFMLTGMRGERKCHLDLLSLGKNESYIVSLTLCEGVIIPSPRVISALRSSHH